MRLTKGMLDEWDAILNRLIALQIEAFSNFPESHDLVLDLYGQEMINYKRTMEEMLELTTIKEWFISLERLLT